MAELHYQAGNALLHWWRWYEKYGFRWGLLFVPLGIAGFLFHWVICSIIALIGYGGNATISVFAVRRGRRRQRHAVALARIQEIEADALMPIEEWLEKEMVRREGKTKSKPVRHSSGYGVTMDEAVQALSLMVGYGHQPTRTVDTSNPPKSGSAVIPPKQRDPYDMSGDYRALHWFDYERRTLAETRTILSLACQDEAHLHCHAIAQTGMKCRCECHRPNRQIMHLATQQPVDVSLACELGNCGECYYVDGAKHCACGCHERLLEEP